MNPEFRRNLWLELTLHRLIAMPATLVLVLALIYAASPDPLGTMAVAAMIASSVLLGVWGAHSAADAVPEETRARTWDTQRMSAIGPWDMTWGKLLGATAFTWYGGVMLLAVLLVAAPRAWSYPAPKIAALIVALSVLLQASTCLAGLSAVRKGVARQGVASGWALVFALLMLGPGVSVLRDERAVTWWYGQFALPDFALASAAVFAAWAVFGLYRSMATALQVRTLPWAFAAFALFVTAYGAGFAADPASFGATRNALLACGFVVSAALTYLFLFTEETGVIVFRRVQSKLARRNLRGALCELPCWTVGLALAAVFGAAAAVSASGAPQGLLQSVALSPVPLFLLLARDAAIMLFFAIAARPARAEAAALFYLLVLYAIAPWLLTLAGLRGVAEIILPPAFERPVFASAVAAVHATLAWAAVFWRWRSHHPEKPPK